MLVTRWVVTGLALVAAAAAIVNGDTMVSGTVFCDQCKDGEINVLDYPLGGVRVLLACPGESGQFAVMREETTNWLGTYTTSFTGTVDLTSCRAQISGNGQGCGEAAGPAQNFRLVFRMFDSEMYTVDPLIAQPTSAAPFCPLSSPQTPLLPPPLILPPVPQLPSLPPLPPLPPLPFSPPSTPLSPLPTSPPLSPSPPSPPLSPSPYLPSLPPLPPLPFLPPSPPFSLPFLPPLPSLPPLPPLPFFPPSSPMPPSPPSEMLSPLPQLPALPPLPQLPSLPPLPALPPMPPEPLLNASACSYQKWMMPEYKCYWSALSPDMKVTLVFGPLASTRYGSNITLHQSMYGRQDPYRTLLREGTTALLNSYASTEFVYQPLDVVRRVNWALMGGSTQQVLMTALRFIKANSGETGNVTCQFTMCG